MEIIKLDKIVASRIAAGEVVDRPASVVRELLDNAVDAGSTKITVSLEEGGIQNITVSDNGKGIASDDLPLAFESHATSKIRTIDDLFHLNTLGFRGEALNSISVCSKLTISSRGSKLTVDNGVYGSVIPGSISNGTTVTAEGLFDKIPARKQFLKRASSEYTECRKTFIEKALGFESIEFILINNGNTDLHLMPESKYQRVLNVLSTDKNFISAETMEMQCKTDDLKIYAVSSKPSQYKRDRSQIKIFVNNRIVDDFAMVKIITNAYSAALPGGAFPYFYLFIEDDPSLIDFNIHPAKRECKIRNRNSIFGPLTSMIRTGLLAKTKEEKPVEAPQLFTHSQLAAQKNDFTYRQHQETQIQTAHLEEVSFDPSWFDKAKKILSKSEQTKNRTPDGMSTSEYCEYRYIGQIFNTFLIAEQGNNILIIDQHAAHERILYDEITSNTDTQPLVVPYRFETDRSVDDFLSENSFIYADLGVTLVRVEQMLWEITSVPAQCRKNEKAIADFISTATGDLEEAKKGLFAVIACHSAIKAGDTLDSITAQKLLDKVFKLKHMVCPHGRSFVHTITKEELYKAVGRIV